MVVAWRWTDGSPVRGWSLSRSGHRHGDLWTHPARGVCPESWLEHHSYIFWALPGPIWLGLLDAWPSWQSSRVASEPTNKMAERGVRSGPHQLNHSSLHQRVLQTSQSPAARSQRQPASSACPSLPHSHRRSLLPAAQPCLLLSDVPGCLQRRCAPAPAAQRRAGRGASKICDFVRQRQRRAWPIATMPAKSGALWLQVRAPSCSAVSPDPLQHCRWL